MRISLKSKYNLTDKIISTIKNLVKKINWPQKRAEMGRITQEYLEGNACSAEIVFGWNRHAVDLGIHEFTSGILCVNNILNRHRKRSEDVNPKILEDIIKIMEFENQADPQLLSTFKYTNKSAANVHKALLVEGWQKDELPKVRTISNILNRNNYRIRSVAKTKVEKKTS